MAATCNIYSFSIQYKWKISQHLELSSFLSPWFDAYLWSFESKIHFSSKNIQFENFNNVILNVHKGVLAQPNQQKTFECKHFCWYIKCKSDHCAWLLHVCKFQKQRLSFNFIAHSWQCAQQIDNDFFVCSNALP